MNVVSIAGALTALSLVIIGGGAQAGDKSASRDAAPQVLAAEATDGSAQLTVHVEAPTGAFRLTYQAGQGWRFATPVAADGRVSLALNGSGAPGMVDAITTEEPQTVFIDGPTGNIFVWFLDRGWQFVGHIPEAGR